YLKRWGLRTRRRGQVSLSSQTYKPLFPQWEAQDMDKLRLQLEPDAKDFLRRLILYNPAKRLSAHQALKHKFLKNAKLVPLPLK
ncbi:hypothetical protein GE061_017696, partial [Apolygus lucorum]